MIIFRQNKRQITGKKHGIIITEDEPSDMGRGLEEGENIFHCVSNPNGRRVASREGVGEVGSVRREKDWRQGEG